MTDNTAKLALIKDEPSFLKGFKPEDDAFNHDAFASVLLDVIKDNEPPLTLGLFGDWGVGKSSIINRLSEKCESENISPVYFNAWQYSGDSFRRQFLLTVAGSKKVIKDDKEREKTVERLKKLNHSGIENKKEPKVTFSNPGILQLTIIFGFYAVMILVAVILNKTNLLPKEVLSYGTGIAGFLAALVAIVFQRIHQVFEVSVDTVTDPQLLFPEQFSTEFHALVCQAKKSYPKNKVVIIVDDLDRCESETIKNILTTLKTFLGHEGCMFIVPMDDSSVVQVFEQDNANHGYEQLRKYFSVSLRIPPINKQDLIMFAKKTAEKHGISANVPYIAALGFCRDARKMKHFLNMYKLKLALANSRADAKFLSNFTVKDIEQQLAKIVVLEYQFPEFYKTIAAYPDALGLFTQAARGGGFSAEKLYLLSDINQQLKSVDHLWKSYPGLKEFLSVTYVIPLDNFDVLVRLKTSKQEAGLGEFGLRLRKAIYASNAEEMTSSLDANFIQSNGELIFDTLQSYFDENLSLPALTAIKISALILEKSSLPDYWQNQLFGSYVQISTRKSIGYKYEKKDISVILDNFERATHLQKKDAISKFKEEVFADTQFYSFDEIINHKAFEKVVETDPSFCIFLNDRVKTWFEKEETASFKNELAQRILNVQYSLAERNEKKISFPSVELLQLFVKAISQDNVAQDIEAKTLFSKVVLDDRNPVQFDSLASPVSEKIAQIFETNITDYKFNKTLALGCQMVLNMRERLSSAVADNISRQIAKYYQNFPQEAIHQFVLVLVICSKSITTKPQQEQCLSQYLAIIDTFNFKDLEAHLKRIGETFGDDGIIEIKTALITRRWAKIVAQVNSPDENIIGGAGVCLRHKNSLNETSFNDFLNTLMTITQNGPLVLWSPFILDAVKMLDVAGKIKLTDAVIENLKKASLAQDARTAYGNLVLGMLDLLDKKSGRERFAAIFSWLSSDDAVLRSFAVRNAQSLKGKFGEQVPNSQSNPVLSSILDKENLVTFEQSISAVRALTSNFEDSISQKIASKLNVELFTFSKSAGHRKTLLEAGTLIKDAGSHAAQLSQTLSMFKDTGDNDELKGKSWELYDLLLKNGTIPKYTAPTDKVETPV